MINGEPLAVFFMMKKNNLCACQSGKDYDQCCGPILAGDPAQTAEQLMRSRYTAFCLNDEAYLLGSWHPDTRPASLNLLVDQQNIKWTGLKILNHEQNESTAIVEFIARFKVGGKAEKIHERSRFVQQDNRWFYVDGDQY